MVYTIVLHFMLLKTPEHPARVVSSCVTVQTQERAKQFLASMQPRDKSERYVVSGEIFSTETNESVAECAFIL